MVNKERGCNKCWYKHKRKTKQKKNKKKMQEKRERVREEGCFWIHLFYVWMRHSIGMHWTRIQFSRVRP